MLKINFKNSRDFYSFTIGGCKLWFRKCPPAVTHPVSKFLQLAATHKNTCLVQTVQSRENIYLQKHDGKHSNHVQDKLHLWVNVCMQKLLAVSDKHKESHKRCVNMHEKQLSFCKRKCECKGVACVCICTNIFYSMEVYVLQYITAVGTLNHTKV